MQVGYARASTKDQNFALLCFALQHAALNKAGCEKIYEDRVSGTKASRQGLNLALEVLRELVTSRSSITCALLLPAASTTCSRSIITEP